MSAGVTGVACGFVRCAQALAKNVSRSEACEPTVANNRGLTS